MLRGMSTEDAYSLSFNETEYTSSVDIAYSLLFHSNRVYPATASWGKPADPATASWGKPADSAENTHLLLTSK